MAFSLRDYTSIKEFARGGMGKVYIATQVSLNRKVIIKEMATGILTKDNEIKRFENEARAAAALSHDNIIRIYDYGEDRNSFYIAMEYIDGPDLDTVMKSKHFLPEIGLLIVLHALRGLNFAHEHKIIHRDIKPGNILISKFGAIKVADFGLAHASAEQVNLTASDTIVGTPLFMSPEQASGTEKKEVGMDIWSAGVLLYRIIAGHYPFQGDNVPAILCRIIQHKEEPLSTIAPALPHELIDTISHCLDKDRSKRLKTLVPVIDSLQNYFYEIGIRDTGAVIRKYVDNASATVENLREQLHAFHTTIAAKLKSQGRVDEATAHELAIRAADNSLRQRLPADSVGKKVHQSDIFGAKRTAETDLEFALKKDVFPKLSSWLIILSIILLVSLLSFFGWTIYSIESEKNTLEHRIAGSNVDKMLNIEKSTQSSGPALVREKSITHGVTGIDTAVIPQKNAGAKNIQDVTQKPAVIAQKTASPDSGTITINVTPQTAEFFLDGKALRTSALTAGKRTIAGVHHLIASAPGFEPYNKSVELHKNENLILSMELQPVARIMSAIHIHSYPWAEIYLDGKFQGNTPTAKPIPLAEGVHLLLLKRDGYKPYQEIINVTNSELRKIKVQLVRE